jgi:hypothetical protein
MDDDEKLRWYEVPIWILGAICGLVMRFVDWLRGGVR